MSDRTQRLRARSLATEPSISAERSQVMTEFYREHLGKHSPPVMRAMAFFELCSRKTITIEPDELIVGERGPSARVTPLFPELTCHSLDDLHVLNEREKTGYRVPDEAFRVYDEEIIPYWRGRTLRDRIFEALPAEWKDAYAAGIFTEFMEQRAPGHTVADGKIYAKGMLDFKADIERARAAVNLLGDPLAPRRLEQLRAMEIAADAVMLFAERHAALAREMAEREAVPG